MSSEKKELIYDDKLDIGNLLAMTDLIIDIGKAKLWKSLNKKEEDAQVV